MNGTTFTPNYDPSGRSHAFPLHKGRVGLPLFFFAEGHHAREKIAERTITPTAFRSHFPPASPSRHPPDTAAVAEKADVRPLTNGHC